MRTSTYLLATIKEIPAEAQIVSHQLMLRAGMIRKLAAGIYNWLPLGFKVLQKVENIVREEMNKIGALEILLPALHPAEVWQETGRWDNFAPPLLKFTDRNDRDFCYGPTHEEVVTDLMRREIKSYKQLPIIVFQIQDKFRDELRPRSGVMRAREFLMKDAYSFNADKASLQESYDKMYKAYYSIFSRLGLNFRAVLADTGTIGGTASHEFQILTPSGEDTIAISDTSDYAANVEMAEALAPETVSVKSNQPIEKFSTPGVKTIDQLCSFLKCQPKQCLKTLIVHAKEKEPTSEHQASAHSLIALVLRGDHELNIVKAEKHPDIAVPLTFASAQTINDYCQCDTGSIGPVNLKMPIIVDRSAAATVDFICGANENDMHYRHFNWGRDAALGAVADLRNVVEGDKSPDGIGHLQLVRGIEAGHIFQLGDKYSKVMHATFLDEKGSQQTIEMGCYGLGVSRLIAATIEQNHDENGIIWPTPMAPFTLALIPLGYYKSNRIRLETDKLYETFKQHNIDILLDDRNERPGVMFADMDLIGVPHRLVLTERGLDDNTIEYKNRRTGKITTLSLSTVVDEILKLLITIHH